MTNIQIKMLGRITKLNFSKISTDVANKLKIGGIYQHYKGNRYLVLHEALHTETNEKMVIYKRLHKDTTSEYNNTIFARPLNMWFEKVEYNNKIIDRFVLSD